MWSHVLTHRWPSPRRAVIRGRVYFENKNHRACRALRILRHFPKLYLYNYVISNTLLQRILLRTKITWTRLGARWREWVITSHRNIDRNYLSLTLFQINWLTSEFPVDFCFLIDNAASQILRLRIGNDEILGGSNISKKKNSNKVSNNYAMMVILVPWLMMHVFVSNTEPAPGRLNISRHTKL